MLSKRHFRSISRKSNSPSIKTEILNRTDSQERFVSNYFSQKEYGLQDARLLDLIYNRYSQAHTGFETRSPKSILSSGNTTTIKQSYLERKRSLEKFELERKVLSKTPTHRLFEKRDYSSDLNKQYNEYIEKIHLSRTGPNSLKRTNHFHDFNKRRNSRSLERISPRYEIMNRDTKPSHSRLNSADDILMRRSPNSYQDLTKGFDSLERESRSLQHRIRSSENRATSEHARTFNIVSKFSPRSEIASPRNFLQSTSPVNFSNQTRSISSQETLQSNLVSKDNDYKYKIYEVEQRIQQRLRQINGEKIDDFNPIQLRSPKSRTITSSYKNDPKLFPERGEKDFSRNIESQGRISMEKYSSTTVVPKDEVSGLISPSSGKNRIYIQKLSSPRVAPQSVRNGPLEEKISQALDKASELNLKIKELKANFERRATSPSEVRSPRELS